MLRRFRLPGLSDPAERLAFPWTPPWEHKQRVVELLRRSLQSERLAALDYRLFASRARESGDETSATLFERIETDEQEHAVMLERRIAEIGW